MAAMIKLRLTEAPRISSVEGLPGLAGRSLDAAFGVVCLDPKASLFAVRTADRVDDLDRRKRLSPEILDAYGDVRIGSS